ncbi:MAG: radical SAM protein [Erythrobacter sp.]|nr:radical SAM protein [Erythrobacter sp.]NCQ63298.1 radical SAM protein [Alphaproteobacteria bacterium]
MTAHQRKGRLAKVVQILRDRPDLRPEYEAAKAVVRAFRRPAFYEVATRCNLFCEGCYYFSDDFSPPPREVRDRTAWEDFFAAEGRRGVTMAYFVGAEPALEQERLIAAAEHFPHGNIGTNGTIRLDPAIPYRIGVSVWGVDEDVDTSLRGANAFAKAIRNYAGDPRAIMLYTLTRSNLGDARRLAEICRDNDLPLTFNMYSPTQSYARKLADRMGPDGKYFRISSKEDNLRWDEGSLAAARRLMDDLIEDFPDTVVYSHAYNAWATQIGPLYDIDPATGIARDCHSRMVEPMRYFKTDLNHAPLEKCGTSDTICSECRMYSGGWSSKFEPRDEDVRDAESFAQWTGMVRTLGRIFLIDRETALAHSKNTQPEQAQILEPAE